jgi:cyanophycinase
MKNKILVILPLIFIFSSCSYEPPVNKEFPKGKLFIIGGGKRPVSMVDEMIRLSGVDTAGYIAILPMASSEPDTSAWYARNQFSERGVSKIYTFNIQDVQACDEKCLDSIRHAAMIYITGGDQSRFMKIVLNTPLHRAIKQAYYGGALIAGTSAGAAVMSEKMITGNEFKHPEYTGDFRTIEAENIELKEGLGLIDQAIIDQHFVWRMRMNRLISVALEHPGKQCFGIDESTALIIDGGLAIVFGESHVVRIINDSDASVNEKGLLGGKDLKLDIFLPGDTIRNAYE